MSRVRVPSSTPWGHSPTAETRDLKSLQCGFESHCPYHFASIAQLVEHSPDKGEVVGSGPTRRTNASSASARPTLIRLVWVERYHLLVPCHDGRVVQCTGLQNLKTVGSNPTRDSNAGVAQW